MLKLIALNYTVVLNIHLYYKWLYITEKNNFLEITVVFVSVILSFSHEKCN